MAIHNSNSFKIGKISIYGNLYGHINLINFSHTDSKDQGLESLGLSEKGLKKDNVEIIKDGHNHKVIILEDGHAQRMDEHLDGKGFHDHTHCSPALGGGVCPPTYPVCCSDGHCHKTGPCQ